MVRHVAGADMFDYHLVCVVLDACLTHAWWVFDAYLTRILMNIGCVIDTRFVHILYSYWCTLGHIWRVYPMETTTTTTATVGGTPKCWLPGLHDHNRTSDSVPYWQKQVRRFAWRSVANHLIGDSYRSIYGARNPMTGCVSLNRLTPRHSKLKPLININITST